MTPKKFEELKEKIISELRIHLLPGLLYHSADHTLDVIASAERIAATESISESELLLLKTAALLHDSGYLFASNNHEEKSCGIARNILPDYQIADAEIEIICKLIMATKIPQSPQNKLEEILCDADLDYLGRDDFFELSQKLFNELKIFEKISDEPKWNVIQISFFEKHHYFTETSKALRNPVKEKHLYSIRSATNTIS